MTLSRRDILRGMSTMLLLPSFTHATGQDGLRDDRQDDDLRRLFGDKPIRSGTRIDLRLVDLAEDGSVVPIQIQTDYPGVHAIALLADKNPVPLIAHFTFGAHAEPFIATRIKLAESTWVRVVAATSTHLYESRKFVRVVQGGCD